MATERILKAGKGWRRVYEVPAEAARKVDQTKGYL